MAERRMLAKTIIRSDAFLEMPTSSQCLYFQLNFEADDEGFVNNPRSTMRFVGCNEDDMRILIGKKFILPFESGVIVIKHWKIHNYIRGDRIHETKYKDEKATLSLDENGSYTACQTNVSQLSDTCHTEVRLGKDRLGKVSKDIVRFAPPTIEEVAAYCTERNNLVDAERFIDYYTSNGWMVGRNKMKDWKSAIRNWEKREKEKPGTNILDEIIREGMRNEPNRHSQDNEIDPIAISGPLQNPR